MREDDESIIKKATPAGMERGGAVAVGDKYFCFCK